MYMFCVIIKKVNFIMRVITGTARGRRLETLDGTDVRPTTDRVKEAIFSSIQFDIEGRRILDLFAGSGQLGIEALSRGANSCTFVDINPESIAVAQRNVKTTGFEDISVFARKDYFSFIASCSDKFGIAFLDPPYRDNMLEKALNSVTGVMEEYGIIICEHPTDIILPSEVNGFSVAKKLKYGKIAVSIYKKGE